jgi:Skp family chaperone for outer membrane proteins
MGWFGKSEEELNKIRTELNDRQTELDNRESDIKSKEANLKHEREILANNKREFETERFNYTEECRRNVETITAEKAELENRRSDIALLEAKAKANFAEAQRDAFNEVIGKRQAELDTRQFELDALVADLAKRM